MHSSIFFPSSLLIFLFLISITFFPRNVRSNICAPFDCGDIKGITYPFRENKQAEHCGHPELVLDCKKDENLVINIMSQKFKVIGIDQNARILKLVREDFKDDICPKQFSNISVDFSLFNYTPDNQNVTLLYDCDPIPAFPPNLKFSCPIRKVPREGYVVVPDLGSEFPWPCGKNLLVPVLKSAFEGLISEYLDVDEVLEGGFEVRWIVDEERHCQDCIGSGGMCGYNFTMKEFNCFCSDHAYRLRCGVNSSPELAPPATASVIDNLPALAPETSPKKTNLGLKVGIGIGSACFAVIVMCIVFFLYQRNYKKRNPHSTLFFRNISSDHSSVKDVEKGGSTYLGVHVFTYEELVEATNNFDPSKELGDGGFGTVYYGKLQDGRGVAVKRLYESNYRRVEQFMNEVEILAHVRHPNLVQLYGCTSRHSRELLLVYEYISNGTVADHLHGEKANVGALPWPIRLNIAVESALALTYLHATDIIHRDVKTYNILLDNNFSVKVADFGLSRLFPTDVTHISTAPQGTPGYVDPEYHHCYQLTSKSDVFSFGVVLVELISSMPAVDITRHRHDINLSTMAINRIQNHALHEIVDPSLGFDSDSTVRKMITAVAELAFQCLQNEKDMRPSMNDVLEELKAIQSRDYSPEKAEKKEVVTDEAVLLKNGPLTLSPDSVTANWVSRNTTPNASG